MLGAAVTAVVALLVGFGAGYAVRRATTTTTTTTTTTLPPTTSSTSSSTTTTLRPLSFCTGAVLTGRLVSSSGAAGTITAVLQVANAAAVPCALRGYPGLQLLSASSTPLPTSTIRGQTQFATAAADAPPSLQRLTPRGTATFQLQYSDVPTGTETTCPTATSINVYVPASAVPVHVVEQLSPCNNGTVNVSPFYGAT
ncbi:MAG TPA: DUF4232 domain-containing protein [Acidimicrobiales bacterium]|jgi:hypothetical protein|nr:DUF4232 domain-containing protein [Acidimicrobiales bacterium]